MTNLKNTPPILIFDYDWPKDLYQAYEKIYEDIISTEYLSPYERPATTVDKLPNTDGYYRIVNGDDEEFWFVNKGKPSHKTTFWLKDTRKQLAYPYSNTDLKEHTSDAGRYLANECIKVCNKFGIEDYNLRLMTLRPGDYLTWHRDSQNTKAAINHNIGVSKDKVEFFDGEYTYDTALLNIQEYHAVENKSNDTRVTIKITSRDLDYQELYKKIVDVSV